MLVFGLPDGSGCSCAGSIRSGAAVPLPEERSLLKQALLTIEKLEARLAARESLLDEPIALVGTGVPLPRWGRFAAEAVGHVVRRAGCNRRVSLEPFRAVTWC